MSSIPNRFNSHGDDANAMNHRGFVPIQMNHNSNTVPSMFTTSDQPNHGNVFSSSPAFTGYQNSHVSSNSLGFNSPHMRINIDSDFVVPYTAQVSSVFNSFPLENNPHLSQISFTQTITKRYFAIVPTNTISSFQNDFERVNPVMDSRTNIWNPTFQPPNFLDTQSEILNPTPLHVIYPYEESAYRHHLDMFASSSNHNNDQRHVFQDGRSSVKSPTPTIVEEITDDSDSEEDEKRGEDQFDGRTHSLPYEKYGPYTCPKCDVVFDTSQKFAAHMPNHYKNETNEEREKRIRAKNMKKYHKLNKKLHHESQQIKPENGDNGGGICGAEASQNPVIIKEEHV